jgi:hypothetical protein
MAKMKSYNLRDYIVLVEQYTSREMTFQSDRLNAFPGTASLISSFLQAKFHYGIPTELSTGACGSRVISMALCWDIQRLALTYQQGSLLQGVSMEHRRKRHSKLKTGKDVQGRPCVPPWAWCAYPGTIESPDFLPVTYTAENCHIELVSMGLVDELGVLSTLSLPGPDYLKDPTYTPLGYQEKLPPGVLWVTAPHVPVLVPGVDRTKSVSKYWDFPRMLLHSSRDKPVGACHIMPEAEIHFMNNINIVVPFETTNTVEKAGMLSACAHALTKQGY